MVTDPVEAEGPLKAQMSAERTHVAIETDGAKMEIHEADNGTVNFSVDDFAFSFMFKITTAGGARGAASVDIEREKLEQFRDCITEVLEE